MELFYSGNIGGNLVTLDAEESLHCVKVLRHKAGDSICVIDGRGSLFHCVLRQADPRGAVAEIQSEERNFGSHPYRLDMAVCPTKNADRFEWFAEKAVEMGVDRISPVEGEHSERRVFKPQRLSRIVLSAAKQSLKAALPEIAELRSVKEYIEGAPAAALRLICYCDEALPRERRCGIVQALEESPSEEICILIGPEGDFSRSELELAFSLGWQPVHLGESRLRTETAAVAAVAAVYFSKGGSR